MRKIFIILIVLIVVALAIAIPLTVMKNAEQNSGGMLDPLTIPKYVDELVIPNVIAPVNQGMINSQISYHVAARQFKQQVLPSTGFKGNPGEPFPATTVWGYGSSESPTSSFSWPGPTFDVMRDQQVYVRWDNQLVDDPEKSNSNFLPHLFFVDQTLHWANPGGVIGDPSGKTAARYEGPVPIVTHLHGAHSDPESDGAPDAWYMPAGFNARGSYYSSVAPAPEGSAWYKYRNDQPAGTLWYHDHTLGITRLNVYAGLTGFYLIRDNAEKALNLPSGKYEVPMAIQDRSFNNDGSLFFPEDRAFFDEFAGPYIPDSDVPPHWNPEFFGNTLTVNGKTWPYLNVEPTLYRLRLLNASDSRFLKLKFGDSTLNPLTLDFIQIGADGGFLPEPASLSELLIGPSERVDALVDFSRFKPGDEIILLNVGPDEPLGGPDIDPSVIANPETTGQVLKFKVIAGAGNSSAIPPALPVEQPLKEENKVRDLTLNEIVSTLGDFPIAALLGTSESGALSWDSPITENPGLGQTEIWRIIDLTEDSHPIHVHQVQFQILQHIPFKEGGVEEYSEAQQDWLDSGKSGAMPLVDDYLDFAKATGPEPGETGRKDTVTVHTGQVTVIKSYFDIAGRYVWHCHIISHEDNGMMRPYEVLKP